jgi:uroporphyrinogen-III synthase
MEGKHIAILESRLGDQLADLLVRYGAVPLQAPALAEVPDLDPAFIRALIEDLQREPPKAAVFQTGVGTQALFRASDELGLTAPLLALLHGATVVARGPKPTGALRSRNVRIDLNAADPFTTNEVLAAMSGLDLAGARVVIQRHGVVNETLDDALTARGARVVEVPLYRWSLPADTAPLVALMDALEERRLDAVAFTSASQAHNLFMLADQLKRHESVADGLNATLVASIGPVCTSALAHYGIKVAVEPHPPKLGPFVAALKQALS